MSEKDARYTHYDVDDLFKLEINNTHTQTHPSPWRGRFENMRDAVMRRFSMVIKSII